MTQNPKMIGTNLVDAIPQTGECPLHCEECFYNGGKFYRDINEPLIPSIEEVKNKIVRVNSGNDSNLNKEYVIKQTINYPYKFYNTSLPNFDFPGPVVFTCNGRNLILANEGLENLMAVRIRVSPFNLDDVSKAVEHYRVNHNIPVIFTFMHYYDDKVIPNEYKNLYIFKQHVINSYYCLTKEAMVSILEKFKGKGIRVCGSPWSSLCKDCNNCELLYWQFLNKKRVE